MPLPPTDKHSTGLAATYAGLFKAWRDRPVRLLEIGIRHGGSLWLWRELFPHADSFFVGLDLKIPEAALPANATALVCDQNDRAGLERVAAAHGPFDLIVDDGSHFTRETRATFEALFAHVKVGGTYIIEDWAVGYWKDKDPRYRGMVEIVTDLMGRAPELSIESFVVILKPGQSLAAFTRSAAGWQC